VYPGEITTHLFAQWRGANMLTPGDDRMPTLLFSSIGETGVIDVVICTPETGKLSRIAVPRPFPCSQSLLFESWRYFFERAAKASDTRGALATPVRHVCCSLGLMFSSK
jgi:hypothetical protein